MRRAAFGRLELQIQARIALGQPPDLRLGDADQHDRLGMLDQPHAGEHGVDMDVGLSRLSHQLALPFEMLMNAVSVSPAEPASIACPQV